jgi:hypothetical protein
LEYVSDLKNIPIRIVASFNVDFSKEGCSLNNIDKKTIMSQRDDKLSRLAPYIDLVIGMPITITQNINTSLGICNGTFGKVIDIQFPQDTLFHKIRDSESDAIFILPTKPANVIIVFIPGGVKCPFLPGNQYIL